MTTIRQIGNRVENQNCLRLFFEFTPFFGLLLQNRNKKKQLQSVL
jgi:hypothetical protein